MTKNHGEKLNDNTRFELFAAVFYLLECCDSKDHSSRGQDFLKYAKEKFGLEYIDRRRATPIFSSIYEFSEQCKRTNNFVLPFVVHKKQLPQGARYYVEKRMLTEPEILELLSSIDQNYQISKVKSSKLKNKLIKLVCTDEQANKINSKAKKIKFKDSTPLDLNNYGLLEKLENIAAEDLIVHFAVKNIHDCDYSTGYLDYRRLTNDNIGRIHSIITIKGKQPKVVIHIDHKEGKFALLTKYENIELLNEGNVPFNSKPYEFNLDNCKYCTVDEWLESFYKGGTGFQENITFKFVIYGDHMDDVKRAYCKWFKKEQMEYKTEERIVPTKRRDENGNIVDDNMVVSDAIVNVTTNFRAFSNFYFENAFYNYMVVVSPAEYNDRLIGGLVERFAKRLTKYGYRYNYEITKTMKPEYSEISKVREEQYRDIIKKRKEYLQTLKQKEGK